MTDWKFRSHAGGWFLHKLRMAISSRKSLLPHKSEKTISDWWLLVTLIAFLGALCIYKSGRGFAAVLAVWVVIAWGGLVIQKRRLQSIAKQRQGDSICTFAQSFDCRATDTQIIRATYEELQKYHASEVSNFPLQADDSLEKTLNIDDGDLDDIAVEIARRAQRSIDNFEQNPLYGKVKTVGDLVLFLNCQPLLPKASE